MSVVDRPTRELEGPDRWSGRVTVRPKAGVLDPEGRSIGKGLRDLGFEQAGEVRVGKVFDVTLEAGSRQAAIAQLQAMAERLLANPVMETFTVEVD